jgi:tetratricopeptide (TPR) repeat protein
MILLYSPHKKGSLYQIEGGMVMKKNGLIFSIILAIALSSIFILTSCGPSKEQIMAREKMRLEQEARKKAEAEAIRKQEEARIQRILSIETAGDQAVQKRELAKAIGHYRDVLKNIARYSDQDLNVRKKVIKAAQAMQPPPERSEDVVRYMMRGQAKMKLGGAGSYEAASKEMEQAVLEAPWWGDGYYNLAIVQEKAGKFSEALQNLQLYIFASPNSPDAKIVQAKIYEIEVMKEEAEKTKGLQGAWSDDCSIVVEGVKIKVTGDGYTMQLEKKGLALEGFISFSSYRKGPCDIPGETNPVSGTISEDGHSIVFRFMKSEYKTSKTHDPSYGWLIPVDICTGVTLLEKTENTIKLVRK